MGKRNIGPHEEVDITGLAAAILVKSAETSPHLMLALPEGTTALAKHNSAWVSRVTKAVMALAFRCANIGGAATWKVGVFSFQIGTKAPDHIQVIFIFLHDA